MGIYAAYDKRPSVNNTCYVAETAAVIGDVRLGAGCGVALDAFFHVVHAQREHQKVVRHALCACDHHALGAVDLQHPLAHAARAQLVHPRIAALEVARRLVARNEVCAQGA